MFIIGGIRIIYVQSDRGTKEQSLKDQVINKEPKCFAQNAKVNIGKVFTSVPIAVLISFTASRRKLKTMGLCGNDRGFLHL
jgi:hypothetical protein